ncbi:MAG: iron ABC transporter [Myxococcales bacterium]|nr:MAG: iron ABC transporter [Myxococcales bacterium]
MDTVLGFDSIAFWIVVTGALVNATGALLGNYLVLRRMSLLGDAISHAVLPGLAAAFILAGTRDLLPMLAGALVAGLVTALLTELIRRYANVPEDAAMGVVFTSLFALGVVLISRAASEVDLDPGCVLYGIIESAALDTTSVFGLEIPRVTLGMAAAALAVIAFILLLWKELKIVAFDADLATTLGFHAQRIHLLLMAMVALYTVAAFEAVGSILVVAMLIVPSATAHLLTDRLDRMMLYAALIGVSSAVLGREAAWAMDTSVAGMMAVAAGAHFALAVFFAPRHGYLARLAFQARVAFRIVIEDVVALLYRYQELRPGEPMARPDAFAALGGGWVNRFAVAWLTLKGFVAEAREALALTERGLERGRTLIRGHRLWESYLAKHFALPSDHLHAPADRMEHYLSEEIVHDVAEDVEHPETDPHGRPIGKN